MSIIFHVYLTCDPFVLQIELPHVNVLSKADLVEKHGKLAFNLDFYTEVLDLEYLLEHFQVGSVAAGGSGLQFAVK